MILKPSRLLLVILSAAAFSAFAQNVATVNGKGIPAGRVDRMVKQLEMSGQKDTPELRAMVKDEMINREILIQEAEKLGLTNNIDVKDALENARQQIVIRALVQDYLKKHPVPDAEIQAEYDKFKAASGDKEYHARHILVEKEDDAKAIITKLKAGEKFEELAKQSKDPGSAGNGGDLDWATPTSFVKPFSDAMVALKPGEITQNPVKTQFGYHVIKLEESRPAKVPGLDEVKPKIMESLQQQRLQKYQADLKKAAKVDEMEGKKAAKAEPAEAKKPAKK